MRIAIIQGHPDPAGGHFCHGLAEAYARGAREAGHDIRLIDVAKFEFPILRSKKDWETGVPAKAISHAYLDIIWAQHIVILFPLWLGTMPALLKGFFEQVLQPGLSQGGKGPESIWTRPLKGRSARVIVTMGMPALAYRFYFLSAGVSNLRRLILGFTGVRPVRQTLIGSIEAQSQAKRTRWLSHIEQLGRTAR